MKARVFVASLMTTFLAIHEAQALTKIFLKNNEKGKISVSQEETTRIALENDRITSIYGNENAFESDSDTQTGQIFLKPLTEKSFLLSFITEKGNTFDLTITPENKEADSVLISIQDFKRKEHREEVLEDSYTNHTIHIMRDLIRGEIQSPFEVKREGLKEIITYKDSLKASLEAVYSNGEEEALVFKLKNESQKEVSLKEEFLFRLGFKAIALESHTLASQSQTKMYVVRG